MNSTITIAISIIIAAVIIVVGFSYLNMSRNISSNTTIPVSTTIKNTHTQNEAYLLNKQQLQSIYGNGTYNVIISNESAIKNLENQGSFPFTSNITSAYEIYYLGNFSTTQDNPTNQNSWFEFLEVVVKTPQANIGFSKMVASGAVSNGALALHSVGNVQYLANYSLQKYGYIGLIQTNNTIVELTCQGFCPYQGLNRTLQQEFNISIIFSPSIETINNNSAKYIGQLVTINGTLGYITNPNCFSSKVASGLFSNINNGVCPQQNASYVVKDNKKNYLRLIFSNSTNNFSLGSNYSFTGTINPNIQCTCPISSIAPSDLEWFYGYQQFVCVRSPTQSDIQNATAHGGFIDSSFCQSSVSAGSPGIRYCTMYNTNNQKENVTIFSCSPYTGYVSLKIASSTKLS